MGRLRKVVAWLLCLVMLSSAVACTGEKSASGQKVSGVKTHQQNSLLTHRKYREKTAAVRDSAPDEVVKENNSLKGWVVRAFRYFGGKGRMVSSSYCIFMLCLRALSGR
jgi:hypothetical protein